MEKLKTMFSQDTLLPAGWILSLLILTLPMGYHVIKEDNKMNTRIERIEVTIENHINDPNIHQPGFQGVNDDIKILQQEDRGFLERLIRLEEKK